MEITKLQHEVDEWIKTIGVRYFNELTNMAMLTEEVGEVARIIARRYGEQSEKESDKTKDLGEVKDLLKTQIERLELEVSKLPENNKPLTGSIRETLKDLMQKELEQLPETLKDLEPVQRLNILCKFMPYVLPKVESVTHTLGEKKKKKKGWFE